MGDYKMIIIYLEDVRKIPEVEDVVELDSSGQEGGGNLLVQVKDERHHGVGHLLYRIGTACEGQMLAEDAAVDGLEGILTGETQSEHAEMSLSKVNR